MKIEQKLWAEQGGWVTHTTEALPADPQLVLVFGDRRSVGEGKTFEEIRGMYPAATILLCSTAGEILDTQVTDATLALTAIAFEKTTLAFSSAAINSFQESREAGKKLVQDLKQEGLVHVMVFADGLHTNGTQLIHGMNEVLPAGVSVTGGFAGDGYDFKQTLIGLNGPAAEHTAVAIGFYGTALRVGYGSIGGWDTLGLGRTITRSKDNIVYEVDGRPILSLYKEYLGDMAKGLPGTGLLFPLRLHTKEGATDVEVIRSFSSVNEADQSIAFFGDMPEGARVTLMRANFERLIDGASQAAKLSTEPLLSGPAELAILISCVGRKLILKERTEEEVEGVRNEIGPGAAMTGFYSYGEICPIVSTEKQCEFHNQTMTITTLREV